MLLKFWVEGITMIVAFILNIWRCLVIHPKCGPAIRFRTVDMRKWLLKGCRGDKERERERPDISFCWREEELLYKLSHLKNALKVDFHFTII